MISAIQFQIYDYGKKNYASYDVASSVKTNHIAKNCKRKVLCYRCKVQGRHNTAICDKENRASATNVAKSNHSVLLQTANGVITDKSDGKNH